MSGFRGHMLGFSVAYVVLLALALHFKVVPENPLLLVSSYFVGLFYSILPDVDTPSSVMRRLVGRVFLAAVLILLTGFVLDFFRIYAIYLSLALAAVLYFLWFVKHRGLLHTPLVGALLSLSLYPTSPYLSGAAFLGFMSHLVLDGEVLR